MANKGGSYEREVCKRLSLWWTHQERDDVFWRSAGSGGRAKVRGRRGVSTYGSDGDIGLLDPIGKPFIDLIMMEIKRGYPHYTLDDILDRAAKSKRQRWEEFHQQVIESWIISKRWTWMLLVKRDNRDEMIYIPHSFFYELIRLGADLDCCVPLIEVTAEFRCYSKGKKPKETKRYITSIAGFRFNDFLENVGPEMITRLAKCRRGEYDHGK